MRSVQLVIFDCDGVLVDSEPVTNRVELRLREAGAHHTFSHRARLPALLSGPYTEAG